jgi:O-antigen/teichoic acid export membrane protein
MSTPDHEVAPPEPEGGADETIKAYTGTAVRGSIWSILQTAGSKGIMLVVQWFLALILLPGDFGLFAIALSTAAMLSICSPLPLMDLLVQRGPRLANALPNLMRIASVSSVLLGLLIAASSYYFGIAEGQRLSTISGEAATAETTLEDIGVNPSFETQLASAEGTFQVFGGEDWHEVALPPLPAGQVSIADFVEMLQGQFDDAGATTGLLVAFDAEQSRIVVRGTGGRPADIRSSSSAESSVLTSLGITHRSETLTLLVVLFGMVPIIMMLRLPLESILRFRMKFGALAAANFGGTIGSGAIAVSLGFFGAGSFALMVGPIAIPLIMSLVMIPLVGGIPKVAVADREPIYPLLRDSAILWIAQWVHTAGLIAPIFVLRYCTSSEEVGYYYFAWLLTVQIIALFSHNLSQAFTPIFSTMQNHPERLASAYLRGANAIAALTIPFMLGTAAIAPILIPQIYADKWMPAVPLLMILMVAQSFASTTAAGASLLKGSGRYRTWFYWQLLQNMVTVGLLVVAGVYGSALTVAWVVVAQQGISSPIGVYLCAGRYATITQVLRVHLVPFVAASPLVGVAYVSYLLGPSWLSLFIWCPIAAIVGGGLYILLLKYLDAKRYNDFVDLLQKGRQKLSRRGTTQVS